jgi:hypothetical protein
MLLSQVSIATQEIERTNQNRKDEWRRESPPLIFSVLCPKQNLHCYKVETLAKLNLESEPATIFDQEIEELCDWLWNEFQTTPLNLEFSWYERYHNQDLRKRT